MRHGIGFGPLLVDLVRPIRREVGRVGEDDDEAVGVVLRMFRRKRPSKRGGNHPRYASDKRAAVLGGFLFQAPS